MWGGSAVVVTREGSLRGRGAWGRERVVPGVIAVGQVRVLEACRGSAWVGEAAVWGGSMVLVA